MVYKIKAEPSPIAYEVSVYPLVETGFLPQDLTIACASRGVASEGTMKAKGGTSLKIPSPAFEPGRLVGVHPCGAHVDKIPGKGALEMPALESAEVLVVGDL